MKWSKIIFGMVKTIYHLIWFEYVRYALKEIVEDIFKENSKKSTGNTFILLVGFTHSGKETLVKNNKQLREMFLVHSDEIHVYLNESLRFLRDDNTITGEAYWERQFLTHIVRKMLLRRAFKSNINVVNDSANLRKRDRSTKLALAKKYGYQTIIIQVQCPESVLLKRLEDSDNKKSDLDQSSNWVALYATQKSRFCPVKGNEADRVIHYHSDFLKPEYLRI
ncbi:ATP-binding protein [Candidatus Falkowbacteria bacterium]|nr:MAG: ATP-binding protein [Candidatus Falkowbacteria bacterium]